MVAIFKYLIFELATKVVQNRFEWASSNLSLVKWYKLDLWGKAVRLESLKLILVTSMNEHKTEAQERNHEELKYLLSLQTHSCVCVLVRGTRV
jgi:hypothetical protein